MPTGRSQAARCLVGEPFWRQEPAQEYLDATELGRDDFATHAGNVQTGLDPGLTALYATTADLNEGLQWQAAERWAASNPDDPDHDTVIESVRRERDACLRWGRDTLGLGSLPLPPPLIGPGAPS